MTRARELVWDGCINVRDLGGLPTEDGGATRFGAVVRADDLGGLSPAGWEALLGYGVSRIVDLRHESGRLLYETKAELLHVPVIDDAGIVAVDELLARVDDPVEWRRRNYMFFLERYADRFAQAIQAVATAPAGTVLVHCAGGVDRTGLVTAMLLRLCGVGVEAVADDYAQSEANWASSVKLWIREAPDEAERRKRRLLSVMPADSMRGLLADLEERHGGVSGYLTTSGATQDDFERIRARLREEDADVAA